ncbi:ATP synthase F1 subunit delta [Mycoplasma leonicaptivi]|uniref:ATP synthase F1 subunit delta n=1 Tax=Mycoplasma leonicaptivi TaxID=36742 RepID=UPI00048325C2|nr:ATP synthase F1 subunit delta [Mycoplasma leonicaptivi]
MYQKRNIAAYAVAIFDLVQEEKIDLKQMQHEFETIKELFNQHLEFFEYLKNDLIPETERLKIVDEIFKDFHWVIINTIKVIVQRKAIQFIKKIIIEYLKLSNRELKIRFIDVVSAFPLSKEELQKIKEKLQKTTRRTIEITNHINPNLISGFQIVSRTEILEVNIKNDLEKIKNNIIYNKEEV